MVHITVYCGVLRAGIHGKNVLLLIPNSNYIQWDKSIQMPVLISPFEYMIMHLVLRGLKFFTFSISP